MYFRHEWDRKALATHTKNQIENARDRLKSVAAKKKLKKAGRLS